MKQGSRTRRYVIITIKLMVAAALLVWLARSGHLDLSVISSARKHWPWLLGAQLVFGLVQWLTAIRWRWLLRAVGIECGILRVFQITLAGLFFNQVLIGSTGGDVYRVLAFRVDGAERRMVIVASVVIDRFLGLYAMVLVIPPMLLWNRSLIENLLYGNDDNDEVVLNEVLTSSGLRDVLGGLADGLQTL